MRYISTRGEAPVLGFSDALLAGLARDGGLYLPENWPQITKTEIAAFAGKSYQDIAFSILSRFTDGEIASERLRSMIKMKARTMVMLLQTTRMLPILM